MQEILNYIKSLSDEEQDLYSKTEITDEEKDRLHKIDEELTQYWDLQRQRRALRRAGRDPDKAKLRKKNIVKRYEQ
ncbi:MAG TPA: DUF2630 family protein [Ignavibacteriaceae bacterium]|nr:DUF2630 family protein [Ignavibacteriaceae bacterium]